MALLCHKCCMEGAPTCINISIEICICVLTLYICVDGYGTTYIYCREMATVTPTSVSCLYHSWSHLAASYWSHVWSHGRMSGRISLSDLEPEVQEVSAATTHKTRVSLSQIISLFSQSISLFSQIISLFSQIMHLDL